MRLELPAGPTSSMVATSTASWALLVASLTGEATRPTLRRRAVPLAHLSPAVGGMEHPRVDDGQPGTLGLILAGRQRTFAGSGCRASASAEERPGR